MTGLRDSGNSPLTEPGARLIATRGICVGDDIVFLGQGHRVTAIEPYDGPLAPLGCFALAKSYDGWGIALYDGDDLEARR